MGQPCQLRRLEGRGDADDEKHRAGGGTYRIRVNSIAPGAIRTPINTAAWQTPEVYEALMTPVPYKRIGETDAIGQAVVWLTSDAAD